MPNDLTVSISERAGCGINGYNLRIFAFDVVCDNIPYDKADIAREAVEKHTRKIFGVLAGTTNGGGYGEHESLDGGQILVSQSTFVRVAEVTRLDKGKVDHLWAIFLKAGIPVDTEDNYIPRMLEATKLPQDYASLIDGYRQAVESAVFPKPKWLARVFKRNSNPEMHA